MRRYGSIQGTVIVCPDGKRAGRAVRLGDAHFALECVHGGRIGPGTDAVHWLYLLPDHDGRTVVVECTAAEVRYIRDFELSIPQARRFLTLTDSRAA